MADSAGDLFDDGEDGEQRAFPATVRRPGPGRPAGSVNKKTLALKQYYQAKGYRDPIAYLGEIVSADPVALWQWFRETTVAEKAGLDGAPSLAEIVALQVKAAAELAPFLHGKAPIRIETDDKALPVLIMDLGTDQVTAARLGKADDGAMSLGGPQGEENQGLSEGEDDASHG